MHKLFHFIFILLSAAVLYAQMNDSQKITGLEENINEVEKLFRTNPEKALLDTEELLQLAVSNKDHQSELRLLQIRCYYYVQRTDLKNQIHFSKQLLKKAKDLNDGGYQALAHVYMMEAYILNELYEKAEQEYGKAYEILEKQNAADSQVIKSKANLHIASAHLFQKRELTEKVIIELKKAIEVHSKFPQRNKRDLFLHNDYSNLAGSYIDINLDSAEYYVKLSMELKKEGTDLFTYKNYSILGSVYLKKKMYSSAVDNFLIADSIGDVFGYTSDKDILYSHLIKSYEGLGDSRNAEKYENKLLNYKYNFEQGKNQSLHDIMANDEQDGKQKIKTFFYISFFFIVISLLVFLFFLIKKNKELARQEEVSREYLQKLNEQDDRQNDKNHTQLIEMVKKNDPAFLADFNLAFPDFVEKLQSIHPAMVQTEVEFCALLKLNLATKDIARYKNIEPRTVRNKKYLIRKKLNIPQETDIYYWFSQL